MKVSSRDMFSLFPVSGHALAYTVLSWLALCVSPELSNQGVTPLAHVFYNLMLSWKPFDLTRFFLLPAFFLLFSWCMDRFSSTDLRRPSIWIPSVLFSLSMVLGKSYEVMNSWWLALEWRNGQLLKSVFIFWGYYMLSSRSIAVIYHLAAKRLSTPLSTSSRIGWYSRRIQKHPFLTIFLTLLICYIPHLIISAPAQLMGDAWAQISQTYPELQTTGTSYILPEQMLNPNVFLNQAHPIFHTLLIHVFLSLGETLFHSLNWGLFFYGVFQLLFLCGAFALCGASLFRAGLISLRYTLVFPVYGLLHPMIYNFSTLVTKDVFYSIFLLVFITELILLITGKASRRNWVLVLISGCLTLLFRNEARIPVLLGCLICIWMCKAHRKVFLKIGGILLAFSLLCFSVIFPALSFTPGSRKEIMSVPFQQIARYVRDYPTDISADEQEVVGRIINYSSLARQYDPDTSDPIKQTFHERATTEDLIEFYRVWARLFLRHPDAYFQSWLNNYYEFFYPGEARMILRTYEWSQECYDYTNLWISGIGKSISPWPVTESLRLRADPLLELLASKVPFLSFLMIPSLYTWAFFFAFCFAIYRRDRTGVSLLSFPLIMIFLCFLNPCNGSYGRYYLPIVFLLPLIPPLFRRNPV